ncbi:MAG: hypothetical protein JWP35_4635 [Caulobacter sp.]|nr:hypothetical protein [Caulobacter sp.]
MRLWMLAAVVAINFGLCAPASAQVTAPDWAKKPSIDSYEAVWPAKALREGRGGKAVIRCDVTERGLLDDCVVVSESPPGEGFGYAALLLAPRFLMKPATRDGVPVRASGVQIPINFGMEGDRKGATPPPPQKAPLDRMASHSPTTPPDPEAGVKMLANPLWIAAPTRADVQAAWPSKAGENITSAQVTMVCNFTADGHLHRCSVQSEEPSTLGFGAAARGLATRFQAPVKPEEAKLVETLWVSIPIHFTRPGAPAEADIRKPRWVRVLSQDDIQALFPAAARAAGLKTGLGVADCAVGANGVLSDCRPGREDPAGMGFAAAAAKAAPAMQMSPWTDGGSPVDGARIKLPIRLTLPDDAAAPAKP